MNSFASVKIHPAVQSIAEQIIIVKANTSSLTSKVLILLTIYLFLKTTSKCCANKARNADQIIKVITTVKKRLPYTPVSVRVCRNKAVYFQGYCSGKKKEGC